jgi:peptidoglycan/LPS O-acetylase OafA/YrhL
MQKTPNWNLQDLRIWRISPGMLRILLAIVVLFHHTLGFFGFGAAAVYLFFALSGYWIARLWHEKYSLLKHPIPTYFFSRWLRLSPVLVSVMIISFVIARYAPEAFDSNALSSLANPKWCLTTLTIAGITTQNLVIGPAWSLAVEMQFYLMFPVLVALIRKNRRVLISMFFISLLFGVFKFSSGTSPVGGNTLIFLPYFLAGISYYLRPTTLPRTTIVLTIIYITITILIVAIPHTRYIINNYPGKSELMILRQNLWFYLSTFLLIPIALSSVRQPSSKFDRFLGNLAYPLYLFHIIPVYLYFYYRDQFDLPKSVLLLLCWVACGTGALIIYWVIDRPFEILRKRLTSN